MVTVLLGRRFLVLQDGLELLVLAVVESLVVQEFQLELQNYLFQEVLVNNQFLFDEQEQLERPLLLVPHSLERVHNDVQPFLCVTHKLH